MQDSLHIHLVVTESAKLENIKIHVKEHSILMEEWLNGKL